MDILELLKEIIGSKATKYITLILLGVTLAYTAPLYIITPGQLEEKLLVIKEDSQKEKIILQIQIYNLTITNLNNELYQLKKLKNSHIADEDDLDRLKEVKKTLDSTKAQRDSLQNIIIKLK